MSKVKIHSIVVIIVVACSCFVGRVSLACDYFSGLRAIVWPLQEATDIPTDTPIWFDSIGPGNADHVQILDSDGNLVEFELEDLEGSAVVRPMSHLQPFTIYTVESIGWSSFSTITFQTGAGPSSDGIRDISILSQDVLAEVETIYSYNAPCEGELFTHKINLSIASQWDANPVPIAYLEATAEGSTETRVWGFNRRYSSRALPDSEEATSLELFLLDPGACITLEATDVWGHTAISEPYCQVDHCIDALGGLCSNINNSDSNVDIEIDHDMRNGAIGGNTGDSSCSAIALTNRNYLPGSVTALFLLCGLLVIARKSDQLS